MHWANQIKFERRIGRPVRHCSLEYLLEEIRPDRQYFCSQGKACKLAGELHFAQWRGGGGERLLQDHKELPGQGEEPRALWQGLRSPRTPASEGMHATGLEERSEGRLLFSCLVYTKPAWAWEPWRASTLLLQGSSLPCPSLCRILQFLWGTPGLMVPSFPRQCCQCSACEGICLALFSHSQLLPLYVSWGMETRPAYCSKELTARSWLLTAVGHQACQETRGVQSPLALQESLYLELNPLCVQLPYTFSQPPAFLMWKETEYGSLESLILFEFKILAVMWITAGTCYSTSMQIWMWQMKDVSQRPVAAILGQEIPTKDHCWRWVGKLPCSSSPRQWAKEAATAAVLPS